MKNKVKSILFALAVITSFNLNAQKLGHINLQEISLDLPAYREAEAELQSLTQKAQKEIQMFQKLTEDEIKEYQSKMDSMSDDAKSRAEADIMERQQNMQKKEYEWQQKIQNRQQELMSNIQTIIFEASKAVAVDEGYLYIFEEGVLIHAGGDDISDKVRKKLGIVTSN